MKNKIVILLLVAVFSLSGIACSSSNGDKASNTTVTDTQNSEMSENSTEANESKDEKVEDEGESNTQAAITKEDKQAIIALLQEISDVKPGSAGSSLRMTRAAAMLCDMSENLSGKLNHEQFNIIVNEWKADVTAEGIEFFKESFSDVKEAALNMADNFSEYSGELEDSGYKCEHDTFSKENINTMNSMIETSPIY